MKTRLSCTHSKAAVELCGRVQFLAPGPPRRFETLPVWLQRLPDLLSWQQQRRQGKRRRRRQRRGRARAAAVPSSG